MVVVKNSGKYKNKYQKSEENWRDLSLELELHLLQFDDVTILILTVMGDNETLFFQSNIYIIIYSL